MDGWIGTGLKILAVVALGGFLVGEVLPYVENHWGAQIQQYGNTTAPLAPTIGG